VQRRARPLRRLQAHARRERGQPRAQAQPDAAEDHCDEPRAGAAAHGQEQGGARGDRQQDEGDIN